MILSIHDEGMTLSNLRTPYTLEPTGCQDHPINPGLRHNKYTVPSKLDAGSSALHEALSTHWHIDLHLEIQALGNHKHLSPPKPDAGSFALHEGSSIIRFRQRGNEDGLSVK